MSRRGLPHVYYRCKPEDHWRDDNCVYCVGGLARCIICDAAEGQLLSYCPGYRLNSEALDACYRGNVIDLDEAIAKKKYLDCRSRPV